MAVSSISSASLLPLSPTCATRTSSRSLSSLSSSGSLINITFSFNNTFSFVTHHQSSSSSSSRSRTNNDRVLGGGRTRTRGGLSCNCLFGLGVPELAVIAGVAALVFGPKKLPEIGRSIGKTVKSFQQAAKEFETELKKEPDSAIDPPVEKAAAASGEEREVIVSSTKGSL